MKSMLLSLISLTVFFTLPSEGRWFWERDGELKCVQGLNGENCYWEEATNTEEERKHLKWQYTEVKINGYVLMRPITTDESINKLYFHILNFLEVLSVRRELEDTDSGKQQFLPLLVDVTNVAISAFNSSPNLARNYWTSQGPRYIEARRQEAKKARCLQAYLRASLQNLGNPDSVIEEGVVTCGFVEK